jgi:hypothetical protein
MVSIRPQKKWQWALLFLALFMALAGIIIAFLPLGLEAVFEKWFLDQGMESAEVEDVDFNPFTGKLIVHDISAWSKGEEVLDVQRMTMEMDWGPLFKKRIRFRGLSIENSTINVSWHEDGSWSVGGLAIPQGGSQEEGPWGLGFLDIELRDVRINYRDPEVQGQVTLSRVKIGPIRSWDPTDETGFDVRIKSEEGSLALEGDSRPLSENPSLSADVKINNLALGWIAPHLKQRGIVAFTGILDSNVTVNARFGADKALEKITLEGSLTMDDLGVEVKSIALKANQEKLSLDGSFAYERGSLTAAGNAVSRGLNIVSLEENSNLLRIEELALRDVGMEDMRRIKIHEMEFQGLKVSADGSDLKILGSELEGKELGAIAAVLNGKAKVGADLDANKNLETMDIEGTVNINDLGCELKQAFLELKQKNISLKGSLAYQRGNGLTVAADAASKDLKIDSTKKKLNVATLKELNIKGFKLDGSGIMAKEARLGEARFLERPQKAESVKDEPSHILGLKELVLRQAGTPDMKRIDIKEVGIHGADGWITMDAEGKMELLTWIERGKQAEKQAEKQEAGMPVRIGETTIAEGSRVVFEDRGVSPPLKLVLESLEAHAGALDSEAPGSKTPVEMKADIGKYSSLNVDGTVQPFADKPAADLSGKLESFDLLTLSPYVTEKLGLDLKSGQLNADAKFHMEDGVMDAESNLLVAKFRGEQAKGEEKFAGLLDIPFKKAISLLRDKNGNIRLRVTVHGDLSDPQFSLHDVIPKAIASAIKEGAVSYYAPLGVTLLTGAALPPGALFVLKKLLKLATTLRFEPIEFPPLAEQLSAESTAHLDQMAELLKERPNVQIVICGLATMADLTAHRAETKASNPESESESKPKGKLESNSEKEPGGEPEKKPITEEEMKWLSGLAQRRSEAVKDYLIQTGGIDAGRLVLCSPEVQESDKAPPRVEVGI